MSKMKKSNSCIVNSIVVALVLSTVIIAAMPVTAAEVSVVSVIRDLPNASDPVYPGKEINVSLTQSGFSMDMGIVTETLPEGFTYKRLASGSGGDYTVYPPYNPTNTLTIEFRMETTVTYIVETGTAEQIETAVFNGTWNTMDSQGDSIKGNVEGNTTITLGEEEPTATPSNGGNGGNGGGDGGIPPTPPAGTPAYIALGANPADIPANGSSTSTITASVWDEEKWVLENLTVNFSTSLGNITESALIMNGTATAVLIAGVEEGVATITAEANLSGDIGIVTNRTAVNFTTPDVTPTPSVTVTPTPTVTVSPTSTETATPSPSPTKKPLIPGFEAIFAIASLFSVAYLVLRRRKGE